MNNVSIKFLLIQSLCIVSLIASNEDLFNHFPLFNINKKGVQRKYSQRCESIDEAFVTFATRNYFKVLEVMIKSVHAFSMRPIVAYGINADIPYDYPNLIKRRINIDPKYAKKPYIYFFKFCIILDSNIRNGVYIEADDIVNYRIDDLFEECKKVNQFPLCPLHPDNPDNQQEMMKALGVTEKTNPYLHGHIIFSDECKPFLNECYETCLTYGKTIKGNWDETVMNVLLWKYGVRDHYLPIYDPTWSAFTSYITEGVLNMNITIKTPIYYHMFHGAKKPIIAEKILSILKQNTGKPIEAIYGTSLDEIERLARENNR